MMRATPMFVVREFYGVDGEVGGPVVNQEGESSAVSGFFGSLEVCVIGKVTLRCVWDCALVHPRG